MRLEDKVRLVAEVLEEKKGEDIVALDLREFATIVDAFILVSAQVPVQARSMADEVERVLGESRVFPWHVEGYGEGRWILMDYGDVVVHIFLQEARELYDLDRLWGDAPSLLPVEKEG